MNYEEHVAAIGLATNEVNRTKALLADATDADDAAHDRLREAEKALRTFNNEQIGAWLTECYASS